MNEALIAAETPRSLRYSLGIRRQEDLARLAQVTSRTLTEIEAGRPARVSTIKRVAHALRVTPGTLLDAMERERVLTKSRAFFRRHKIGGGS